MRNRFKNFIGKNFPKTFRTAATGNSFTLKNTDFGKINVECDLIRRFVERSVKEIGGIFSASATIDPPTEKTSLQIHFDLSLNQGFSAPNIGKQLDETVREVLQKNLQIIDVEIHKRVIDISQPVQKKSGRRVR